MYHNQCEMNMLCPRQELDEVRMDSVLVTSFTWIESTLQCFHLNRSKPLLKNSLMESKLKSLKAQLLPPPSILPVPLANYNPNTKSYIVINFVSVQHPYIIDQFLDYTRKSKYLPSLPA